MQNVECALVLANPDATFWNKEEELRYTQGELVSADLSAKVVAVCGVLLPRQQFGPGENVSKGLIRKLNSLALILIYLLPTLALGDFSLKREESWAFVSLKIST